MQRLIKTSYNLLIVNNLKTYICLACIVLLMVTSTGCKLDKKLTSQKAQSTIEKWAGGNGSYQVQGVTEVTEKNAATVNFTVDGFKISSDLFGTRSYNGPGVAIFSHYNDGRWAMTTITFTNELLATYQTNVVVE